MYSRQNSTCPAGLPHAGSAAYVSGAQKWTAISIESSENTEAVWNIVETCNWEGAELVFNSAYAHCIHSHLPNPELRLDHVLTPASLSTMNRNEIASPNAPQKSFSNSTSADTRGETPESTASESRETPYRLSKIQTSRSREQDGESEVSSRASQDVPKNGFFSPHDGPIGEHEDREPETVPENHGGEEQTPRAEEEGKHLSPSESTPTTTNGDSQDSRPDESAPNEASGQAELPARPVPSHMRRSSTVPSMVFVVTALENIASSKEARKRKGLGDSVQTALNAIKQNEALSPETIFEPLRLATETGSIPLTTNALDCIAKLITYSYFAMPAALPMPDEKQPIPLIERAIDTICDCFQDEATPPDVQLQIMKSLLAAVLNDKIIVHGAGLLKAVRQIYNIFLLSRSVPNQQVAQGTLTQMVGTVFERVKLRLAQKEARLNLSNGASGRNTANGSQSDLNGTIVVTEADGNNHDVDVEGSSEAASTSQSNAEPSEKLTLQSFEHSKNFDDTRIGDNVPTMVTRAPTPLKARRTASGSQINGEEGHTSTEEDDEDEIYVKDAFLVFRSMCRLSTKILPQEQLQDLRSQNMRSKLISLAIIRTLMNNNMEVFVSPLVTIQGSANNEPTSFGSAVNQYLRLALSRNGSSAVKQVFETSCEIFWLMLKDMRVMLKREIEVFLKEIYFSILDRRNTPNFQKLYIMRILRRVANEPRALVEVYLNYDCDRTALDNMFQKTIEHLSRFCTTPVTISPQQQQQWQDQQTRDSAGDFEWREAGKIPPPLTTAALSHHQNQETDVPTEYILKQHSLEALVRTLRSLVSWSQETMAASAIKPLEQASRSSLDDPRKSLERMQQIGNSPRVSVADIPLAPSTPLLDDDPSQFEKAKQKKTALINGIRLFNFKPKRGIKALIDNGFIADDSPERIAQFIAQSEQLDKTMIGEYLGEADPQNVAIMHAFVDTMDFAKRTFVDALRQFLQSFRLPGEAQKIDRFMLKFAERYITGNPQVFANADTAYVLAYSAVMLNTDQHSSKIRGATRMTREDFIKNNRGINDNADLPDELLTEVYHEIQNREIVLDTEREHAAALGITVPAPGGLTGGLFSRDFEKEALYQADQEMSSKAEQRLRSMIRSARKVPTKAGFPKYVPATSFKHAGPMFDVTWMSFLSGFSSQMQQSQNIEVLKTCMEGIKLAIKLSCLFDLETPRVAFVTYLANLTNLSNPREIMAKNLEALRALLDVALTEGNMLKNSWVEILTCVSQLDRLQLITGGVDEDVVPDVRKGSVVDGLKNPPAPMRRSMTTGRKARAQAAAAHNNYQAEIVQEATSTDMIRTIDKIFTGSAKLNGDAIVHFVRALSEVSSSEIQSSGHNDSPRMYSLQKVVEISYWNMTRVRFEWTTIWQVLGEHFNEVGCHNNTNIVFFALDSLRQLSMRFMEIEELPGFKFQKDFLKPFEHVIANSSVVTVKDMVLRCLIQMIQTRAANIRSGWKTMFGVFTVAAREPYGEPKVCALRTLLLMNQRISSKPLIRPSNTHL